MRRGQRPCIQSPWLSCVDHRAGFCIYNCAPLPFFAACVPKSCLLCSFAGGQRMQWPVRLFLAALVCAAAGCHPAFQGGTLRKIRGPLFTTNYFGHFQELDLNKEGSYVAVFRGFPSSHAYLDLMLIGRASVDREFLLQLTTEVVMELDKANGTPVCRAAGRLGQHVWGSHAWALNPGWEQGSFSHAGCHLLKLRREELYTLKITVKGANEALGPLRVYPLLWTPHD
jgi:hypothetical protein